VLVTFWRARLRVVPIAVGLLAAELLVAGAAHRYPFLEERTSIFSPRCSLSVGRGGRRGGAWSVRCPLTIPLGITMVVAAVGLLVPAARAGALHPLPTSTVRQQVAHVLAHRHPGGDWNPPGSARPPEKSWITATAYYYLAADLLAKTAKVLGRPAEAAKYARLRDRIRKAFIERFLDPRTNTFVTPTPAGYRQISNAIPLAFGLVPEDRREAVAAKLAANVRGPSRGHLNTGMFGFETFTVRPGLFGDLKEVRASTETVRGRITVHWRTGPGGRLQLDLTVPGNSTATVHLAARSVSAITESGNAISGTAGVRVVGASHGTAVLSVGSGSYRFDVAGWRETSSG
jgi:Bacterial alpha-L-rhamnosidase 6 hairpin glycosidase domain/Bacterial alpha-L-rhamnosidase C-terminal domain